MSACTALSPSVEATPCLVGKYRGIVWHVRRVGSTAGVYSDVLAVAPSASMVMVTTHQQIVLNAFSYGVALGTRGGGHVFSIDMMKF